jgi:hypothetical protein
VLEDDEGHTDEWVDPADDQTPTDDHATIEGHAAPAPIERFHRTSVGMALAAGMFGLRDVLEPPKDETPAIVEDWAGGEPFNEPMVLRLDPEHPEDSIVMIRPHLMRKPDEPPVA